MKGPVTGGVLRGERGRFQLFGDTMNTTASLESSSQKNKIQVSKETAEILMTNGKSSWLEKRADRINAKGKGILETYWLNTGSNRARSVASGCSSSDIDKAAHVGSKSQRSSVEARARRLINWNVETLLRLLRQIVAHREAKGLEPTSFKGSTAGDPDRMIRKAATPLEEVEEIISLPKFNAKAAKKQKDPDSVEIPEVVVEELRSFVTAIAAMYRNNPFHNFDHASVSE